MAQDIVRTLEPFHILHHNSACNLKCFYCYEEHHDLDLDRIRADIEEGLHFAKSAGYRVVVFTSGELLMLPFWKEEMELARSLGFEDIILVTNLTLLDRESIRVLADTGLTSVAGTIFALDDQEAQAVTGREGVFEKQLAAVHSLAEIPGIDFYAHIMLTRQMTGNLWERIERLRDLLQVRLKTVMFSAIEPVSQAVINHPGYTSALELDWESNLDTADQKGLAVMVQNIPACLLGRYAHRSYTIRKRAGRILTGWPDDPEQAQRINRAESLYGRLAPRGECEDCRLISVCQRFYDYPHKKKTEGVSDLDVVQNMFSEEGISADAQPVVEILRRIEDSKTPECLYSGRKD